MKTITFSNSHVTAIRYALEARVIYMEKMLRDGAGWMGDSELMHIRDQLDIARQARALVEG